MVDFKGRTPINISLNTAGLDTARIWLKRGILHQSDLGLDHTRMACRYDHPETLAFLEKEAKIDLISFSKGLSSIEYSFRRGSFNCFDYLLKYYGRSKYFEGDVEHL